MLKPGRTSAAAGTTGVSRCASAYMLGTPGVLAAIMMAVLRYGKACTRHSAIYR